MCTPPTSPGWCPQTLGPEKEGQGLGEAPAASGPTVARTLTPGARGSSPSQARSMAPPIPQLLRRHF